MKKIPKNTETDEMLLWMIFTNELTSRNKKDADRLVKYIIRFIHKFHKICEKRDHYKKKIILYRKEGIGFYFEEILMPYHSYILRKDKFVPDRIPLSNSTGFNEVQEFLFSNIFNLTDHGTISMEKRVHKEGFNAFCYNLILRNYPTYGNNKEPEI